MFHSDSPPALPALQPAAAPVSSNSIAALLREIDGLLRQTIEVSRQQVAHLDQVLEKLGRKADESGEPQGERSEEDETAACAST